MELVLPARAAGRVELVEQIVAARARVAERLERAHEWRGTGGRAVVGRARALGYGRRDFKARVGAGNVCRGIAKRCLLDLAAVRSTLRRLCAGGQGESAKSAAKMRSGNAHDGHVGSATDLGIHCHVVLEHFDLARVEICGNSRHAEFDSKAQGESAHG